VIQNQLHTPVARQLVKTPVRNLAAAPNSLTPQFGLCSDNWMGYTPVEAKGKAWLRRIESNFRKAL
jgi:hypothetical protein